MIKFNTRGKIKLGEYKGWHVYVLYKPSELEGYYIILSKNPDDPDSGPNFDNWAQDYDTLVEFFTDDYPEVEWSDVRDPTGFIRNFD